MLPWNIVLSMASRKWSFVRVMFKKKKSNKLMFAFLSCCCSQTWTGSYRMLWPKDVVLRHDWNEQKNVFMTSFSYLLWFLGSHASNDIYRLGCARSYRGFRGGEPGKSCEAKTLDPPNHTLLRIAAHLLFRRTRDKPFPAFDGGCPANNRTQEKNSLTKKMRSVLGH